MSRSEERKADIQSVCVTRSDSFWNDLKAPAIHFQTLVCDQVFSLKLFNEVYEVDSAHLIQGGLKVRRVTANRKLGATEKMIAEQIAIKSSSK